MIKRYLIVFLLVLLSLSGWTQAFLPLWPQGQMPNSKGLKMTDSIYDERYRRVGDPGMFVYKAPEAINTGTAVIICPGGGYKHYAYISSGLKVAEWLNSKGINAFVLISRLPHSPDLIDRTIVPLQDAERAMRLIRGNAEKWGINPDKIGIMGSSAGGHVASTLGTHTHDVASIGDALDSVSFRPDFMILVSPVITMGEYTHTGSRDNLLGPNPSDDLIKKYSNELQVTPQTPPAFIVHADNDTGVSPENSLLFYRALRSANVSASIHIFPYGGHAIGMENNPGSTALWKELCEMWLAEKGFL